MIAYLNNTLAYMNTELDIFFISVLINKRAGSLINSINEYTIIYKSMTVFQPIASAFFCLSVCQFALNSWITSGRLM